MSCFDANQSNACPLAHAECQQVLTVQDPRTFHEVVETVQKRRRFASPSPKTDLKKKGYYKTSAFHPYRP
jgi:hypothetical protein